jgi:hypothetical protein
MIWVPLPEKTTVVFKPAQKKRHKRRKSQDQTPLKVEIVPPESFNEERLLHALEMLVSEKDFIEYFAALRKKESEAGETGNPG